jgi:hypothetical protein
VSFLGFQVHIFAVLLVHIDGMYPEARLVGTVFLGFLLMEARLLIVLSLQQMPQVSIFRM